VNTPATANFCLFAWAIFSLYLCQLYQGQHYPPKFLGLFPLPLQIFAQLVACGRLKSPNIDLASLKIQFQELGQATTISSFSASADTPNENASAFILIVLSSIQIASNLDALILF
jgi:hypothetical protein